MFHAAFAVSRGVHQAIEQYIVLRVAIKIGPKRRKVVERLGHVANYIAISLRPFYMDGTEKCLNMTHIHKALKA